MIRHHRQIVGLLTLVSLLGFGSLSGTAAFARGGGHGGGHPGGGHVNVGHASSAGHSFAHAAPSVHTFTLSAPAVHNFAHAAPNVHTFTHSAPAVHNFAHASPTIHSSTRPNVTPHVNNYVHNNVARPTVNNNLHNNVHTALPGLAHNGANHNYTGTHNYAGLDHAYSHNSAYSHNYANGLGHNYAHGGANYGNYAHNYNYGHNNGGHDWYAHNDGHNWYAHDWNRHGYYPWNYPFWTGLYLGGLGYGYPSYGYDYGYSPLYTDQVYTAALPAPTAVPIAADQTSYLGQAQEAFKSGNYQDALRLAGHAAVDDPQDPNPHELASLSLMALDDYQGAAMEAHAMAALGAPYNWQQLASNYDDIGAYTTQLRDLEKYVAVHQDSADAHFLLGMQYLMTGYDSAAAAQFTKVTQLTPNDDIAQGLLKKLQV